MNVPKLHLYTRPGCHLCEEMKEVLRRAAKQVAFELSEVDIDLDPQLQRRFGESIPVLAIDGRVAFKVRLTLERFLEKLRRRLAEEDSPCPE